MNIKKIAIGISSIAIVASSAVLPSFAATTIVVTGNTAAGENQPGWMFNRDASTSTPYEFNMDQPKIGSGSLYVLPITNTNGTPGTRDKFIAENFINAPISDVNSISYDFMIAGSGDEADKVHFYMNVYANFGQSDDFKYYDCRYDIVPTIGSTAGFTTVTFDPTQAYPVTTRADSLSTPLINEASPATCPAKPADMNGISAGSNIRAFAINVGDTSANDQGLGGYLDNVIVDTEEDIVTYDFEVNVPTPTATPTPNPFAIPTECQGIAGLGAPIIGTSKSETLNGTNGNDLIFAMGGSDKVVGNGGDDCIVGGPGSDKLLGNNGADVILGGPGADSIEGNNGTDTLYGQADADSLKGGGDNDTLIGGAGYDSARGEGQIDTCDAETELTCEL